MSEFDQISRTNDSRLFEQENAKIKIRNCGTFVAQSGSQSLERYHFEFEHGIANNQNSLFLVPSGNNKGQQCGLSEDLSGQ